LFNFLIIFAMKKKSVLQVLAQVAIAALTALLTSLGVN